MSSEVKKAPATNDGQASAHDKSYLFDKDTISLLPRQQYRLLSFLLRAKRPASVVDIIVALGQSDPRGHISRLRSRGYPIGDVWHTTSEGNRYKCYFIRKEVGNGK